jgi:hypothetical protein
MAKPKLALIPAAQGTKLYSVLPSDGVGDFDFTRGSVATRINAQGLIENVASGQSRLDYPMIDGVQKGCPHHILEPARTNLFSYSEDFNSGSPNWVLYGGATVTSNNAISPDGTLNADKLSNQGGIYSQRVYNPNIDYVFSLFIKKNTATGLHMNFVDQSSGYLGGTIIYTYSSGAIQITQSANSSVSAKSVDYGNGWIRLIMKFTTNVAQNYNYQAIESIGGDSLIWGAMLEQGSYPTSYIPTNGTAVTRSAETANGAGNSSTFNDSEGVLMAEIANSETTTGSYLGICNGSSSERLIIGNEGGLLRVYTDVFVSGNIQSANKDFNKIAVKYNSSNTSIYYNGFLIKSINVSANLSGINELKFTSGGSAQNFYGKAKQIQYFDSALDSQQLEQLTSWQSFRDMAEGQLYTIE